MLYIEFFKNIFSKLTNKMELKEFLKEFRQESDSTKKLFSFLTDKSLYQKVNKEGRDIGQIAWHIIVSVGEIGTKMGLKINCPPEDSIPIYNEAEIKTAYINASNSLNNEIEKNWTDATLNEEIEAYGETWKKGVFLSMLIKHEIHHRGQLTVLMRQAGLMVPGVFGPSKEEWGNFGVNPPSY